MRSSLRDRGRAPTVHGAGFRALIGQGAQIDTTAAQSKLVFGIFAALAEFERAPFY
jgi:DNA invertase Pin-like site-specific DNA recombinase